MAVRGSPAKGVGWGNWREGSNPSFSAKIALHHQVRRYFSYNTFFIALRFLKRYNEYGIKYLLITYNALCGERRRLYGFGRKIV